MISIKSDRKRNILKKRFYYLGIIFLLILPFVAAFVSFVSKNQIEKPAAQAYKINVTEAEGFNIIELDEDQFTIESHVPFQCSDAICQSQEYCPTANNRLRVQDLEGPANTDLMVLGIGMAASNLEQNAEITHSNMGYINESTQGVECGRIDFQVTDSGDWEITSYGGDTPAFLRHSQGQCNLVSEEPIVTDIGVGTNGQGLETVIPSHLVSYCSDHPRGVATYTDAGGGEHDYVQVATMGVGCFQNESELTVNSLTPDLICSIDPADSNHVFCVVHEGIIDPTIRIGYEVTPVDYWMRGITFYGGHARAYPGYEGAIPDVLYQNTFGGVDYTELEFNNLCGVPTSCGDGTVQNPNDAGENEECDDGNMVDGDGCDADCTLPVCTEICLEEYGCNGDLGCTNGTCMNSICPGDNDCVCATCGDGDMDDGEECDDGNMADGDGCEADCTLPGCQEVCTEEYGCEEGMECTDGICINSTCPEEEDCSCELCGDGNIQLPETWDEPWGSDEIMATGYGRMQVDIYDCCETQQGVLALTGPEPSTESIEMSFRETEWQYLAQGTYSYVATPSDSNCGDPYEGTFTVDGCQEQLLDLECEEGEPEIRKTVNDTDRVTLRGGNDATYTLHYSNSSGQTLQNVTISDPFDNQNQNYIRFISQSSAPSVSFDELTMTWTIGGLAPGAEGSIDIVIEILNEDDLPDNSLEILNDFTMNWDGGELTSDEVIIIIPYSAQTGAGLLAIILSVVLGGGIAASYVLLKQGSISFLKK